MSSIENEVVGFELFGEGNAVSEDFFTGVEQVKSTNDGNDFLIRKCLMYGF